MNHFQPFNVAPAIPDKLHFLEVLARNLWWSWNADAIELFRRISRELWKEAQHNPVVFLNRLPQEKLNALLTDESFLAQMERVHKAYETAVLKPADTRNPFYQESDWIVYFSAEFGIHESLPLFAGGLGVLAGDHLKAASNIGLPLAAVGLLYRQGYFRQYLNNDGWQQETYPENEVHNLPLEKVLTPEGNQRQIRIPMPAGDLRAVIWKVQVGRIPLFLLDANIAENPPAFREVTAQLYGGDHQTRLLQEILLGVGGLQALLDMGVNPQVCHMNEGHSAFISLARMGHLMQAHKLDKKAALEIIARTNIFTTHTPVAAGHDEFPADMIRPIFETWHEWLHLSPDDLLGWGRSPHAAAHDPFSMTILALRFSQYANGVSKLHGSVARRMWAPLWPGKPEDEVPITSITNGVHSPSWLSPENSLLFDRYLGPQWQFRPGDTAMLARIDQIPDEELWRAHELGRSRLIRECREHLVCRLKRRNAGRSELELARAVLDPHSLTIGFARRFATYKRAGLLLRDPARLEALLSGKHPIQIIFAGKAHPRDNEGKDLIRQIIHFSRRPAVRQRIIFLEDYDIDIARFLVQGADVWLNTPRRPLEASGTSGMKAAVNGTLNVSILDGWWAEGYAPECGWSIGSGEEYQDAAYQDAVESQALYNLLEQDLAPCFYQRPDDHLPVMWVKMMKAAVKMAFSRFSSHRMVREYEERFYLPALKRSRELFANNLEEPRQLVKQHARLNRLWAQMQVGKPAAQLGADPLRVGDAFVITVPVRLGELKPDEVEVELYYGPLSMTGKIAVSHRQTMTLKETREHGDYVFECRLDCRTTGRYGFTARVIPHGDTWTQSLPGMITWAE